MQNQQLIQHLHSTCDKKADVTMIHDKTTQIEKQIQQNTKSVSYNNCLM